MAIPQGAAPSPRQPTLTPAIIILGADALLAARPATPGQLVNACYAAGYSAVIPSSWGDELVAAGCLREIAARGQGSVVLCACPRVGERMRRVQSLLPQLLPMASPPVAAARYLRARAGRHGVHITYVGECPGGGDASIDRHATPGALLRSLSKRGIELAAQPREVEERLLRDARRFYSLPGGAPAPNWLYVEKRGYTLIEPSGRDFLAEVAYRVSKRERRVVDLAPRLGCSCSGVVVGQPWNEARDKVAAAEPPRAVHEVLDHDVPVDLSAPLDPWTGSAVGGEATVAISLESLAALYDAEAKASTIRTLPPPPVPRRRTSGGNSAEPTTPTGVTEPVTKPLAVSVASDAEAPPLEVVPASVDEPLETPRPRISREHPTPTLSELPFSGPTDLLVAKLDPPTASSNESVTTAEHHIDDATDEDARSVNSAAVWPFRQPQPGRVRQSVVLGACLLLAVSATTVVALLRAGRLSFRTAGHAASQAPPAHPASVHASAPTVSGPTDATASTDTTSANPDSVSMDTAGAMPATPDLPRLPIRSTSIGNPPDDRQSSPSDESRSPTSFRPNPAPVFTPGAAPIPRAVQRANERPPADIQYAPLSSRPSRVSHAADSATAIRAEIARRRHRVDSLRTLLDSLARKARPDSQ